MKKTILFFVAIVSLSFGAVTFAQTSALQTSAQTKAAPAPTGVTSAEVNSKLMGRKMPYRILLPVNYETEKNTRYPVLYLLHGLGGNHTNWTDKTRLAEYAKQFNIIIVTPEGGNGWYSDSATKPTDKYESYIIQELIPEIDRNFRTVAERRARAVAGLSMGGYGALKFGAKYPDKFVLAGSMSGAVSIASWQNAEQIPPMFRPLILATFGDENNQVKKDNDLFKMMSEVAPDKIPNLPFFYFDCGIEDQLMLLPFNQQLAAIMIQRKIPHEFRQLPGKHSWDYWDQQVEEVLRLSNRMFNAKPAATTAAAAK